MLIGCRNIEVQTQQWEILRNCMLKCENVKQYQPVYIVGEFHFPTIKWNVVWSGNSDNEFISNIRNALLIQVVREPTRRRAGHTSNILELVLVNDENLIPISIGIACMMALLMNIGYH